LGDPYLPSGKRVVTAEDVERTPPGELVSIPEGAVLTPLAIDLLRKRGQPVFEKSAARSPALTPLVVANWKSYKTVAEARAFAKAFLKAAPRGRARAVVCPPFTALAGLGAELGVAADLGAQDCSPFEEGAHTGEVAARHLVELGCRYVILGHSERRAERGETDELIRKKVRLALASGLKPILCVGETAEERAAGRTSGVVRGQLRAVLEGLDPERAGDLVVAYEPRWAIGRGVVPRDDEIVAAIADAHDEIGRVLGQGAVRVPVLYGGSVAVENAARILRLPGVGGGLVGGASLNPEGFAKLVVAAG
jgi:triosephosphate isomerase